MLKNARRRPTCKIASKRVRFCRYRFLLCARHGCKNRSKSSKFYHKITTKSTNAVVAMVRNARCRSTCEHASKRVDFCRSRCCFARGKCAEIIETVISENLFISIQRNMHPSITIAKFEFPPAMLKNGFPDRCGPHPGNILDRTA